jgi:hypothetical protein
MTETLPSAPVELPKVLMPGELEQLAKCEQTIERGLFTFYEVGSALAAIRDKRLYRAEFGNFEEYCAARWKMNASRARQLCGAANVMITLGESVTTGNTLPRLMLPANERQARPLLKLPEKEWVSAWHEAYTTAPTGVVTGAHVERIVRKRLGQPEPVIPPPSAPETKPEAKPEPSSTPINGKEARLRAALEDAMEASRELVTEIGTPDSEAASKVVGIVEALQDYQLHLERMGKLHNARK